MTEAQRKDLERDRIGVDLRRAVLDAEEASAEGVEIEARLLDECAAAIAAITARQKRNARKAA